MSNTRTDVTRPGPIRTTRRLASRVLVLVLGVVALLSLTTGTAAAGVPDVRLDKQTSVDYGECGKLSLSLHDYVDFRKPEFYSSTSAEVTSSVVLWWQQWYCTDRPQPPLPTVHVTERFAFHGRSTNWNFGLSKTPGADAAISSQDEGGFEREYDPIASWNADDGREWRWEAQTVGLSAKGRNLSVTHEVVATLADPNGNPLTMSVAGEARD